MEMSLSACSLTMSYTDSKVMSPASPVSIALAITEPMDPHPIRPAVIVSQITSSHSICEMLVDLKGDVG